eukprot:5978657-Ditylum_brightwellii.AAC.1
MVDSDKETTPVHYDKKYEGGTALLFLDHDFAGYHITKWYQWEIKVQLLAKGATQLNSVNDVETKVKALLRCLKVKNFLKSAKDVKDLLGYNTIDGRYKN